MNDNTPQFQGFAEPTQNWSKLPHAFIDLLPLFTSQGEMAVVLYILRHTWGYGDESKRISLDEFMNGRKQKDGTRIDSGVGMSKPSIIQGIKRAIEHGFITVETDDTDKARIEKSYSIKRLEVKNLDSSGKETLHPMSRNDTSYIERHSSKKKDIASDKPTQAPVEKQLKKEHPNKPYFDAIVTVFGYNPERMTKSQEKLIGIASGELRLAGYTPDDIAVIYAYCKRTFKDLSFTAMALAKHAGDAIKAKTKTRKWEEA